MFLLYFILSIIIIILLFLSFIMFVYFRRIKGNKKEKQLLVSQANPNSIENKTNEIFGHHSTIDIHKNNKNKKNKEEMANYFDGNDRDFNITTQRKTNGELPCMEVYLNDKYQYADFLLKKQNEEALTDLNKNHIPGMEINNNFPIIFSKETNNKKYHQNEDDEQKEYIELTNREHEWIELNKKHHDGDVSQITNKPFNNTTHRKISTVYDAKNESKIIDYTNKKNVIDPESSIKESFSDYEPLHEVRFQQKHGIIFNANNMKVYLINMKNSIDRLKRFEESYIASDLSLIPFERVEAIDGRKIDLTPIVSETAYKRMIEAESKGYRLHHHELTRGAVGCYLSHKEVYKRISQQDEDYGLIFEDDVKLSSLNLMEEINNIVNTVPKDWDILLLGCVCFVCGKYSSYYDVDRYFLMHAYIVKKSSAKKILHLIDQKKIEQQIDAHFSDLTEKGLLKIYCLRDKLANQWDMGTNIQLPVKNIEGVNPFDAYQE